MKDSLRVVTPCLLVAVAFPFLFLLAPDGIPVVLAACDTPPFQGAINGTVQNLTVNTCGNCTLSYANGDKIQVNSCSASKHSTKCEIYANLNITITVDTSGTPNGCDARWDKYCTTNCNNTLAASGAGTHAISTAHWCTANNDLIVIQLEKDPTICDCTNGTGADHFFEASGTCQT